MIKFNWNTADSKQIHHHLLDCDNTFVPSLSSRVDLANYAAKLFERAQRIECFDKDDLSGLLAFYLVDDQEVFITSISISPAYQGRGLGKQLLFELEDYCQKNSILRIVLRVSKDNKSAIKFYNASNFVARKEKEPSEIEYEMVKHLKNLSKPRDCT